MSGTETDANSAPNGNAAGTFWSLREIEPAFPFERRKPHPIRHGEAEHDEPDARRAQER
jgi:hypothetical protein